MSLKNHGKPWKMSEEKFLIDNYSKLGPKGCARALSRSKSAVVAHVIYMRERGVDIQSQRKSMDSEELDKVKSFWEAGKTIPQISWKLDVCENRVISCLQHLDLLGRKLVKWKEEDEEKLRSLIQSGATYKDAALALGRSKDATQQHWYKIRNEAIE